MLTCEMWLLRQLKNVVLLVAKVMTESPGMTYNRCQVCSIQLILFYYL